MKDGGGVASLQLEEGPSNRSWAHRGPQHCLEKHPNLSPLPTPSLLLISFINQTETEARKQGIPRDVIGLALPPRKKAGRDRRVKRREVHMGITNRLSILATGPRPIWDPVEKEHNL